jgi:leader peptidase (prepilin peptidase)/N-methyltransferase
MRGTTKRAANIPAGRSEERRCHLGGAVRYRRAVTALLVVGCSLVGLLVGSFLNVVIYRVPLKVSVVRPRSSCPSCDAPIANRDNIPVLSWLLLRGRCRGCAQPISPRYPLVELLTATLFAATALRFGPSWSLPPFLVLVAGLLALACTDLEHFLLPVRIVYPLLGSVTVLLVLAAAATGRWHRLVIAMVCAAASFGFFFVINFVNPRWLAFGDVRLSLVIGLGLGWLGPGYVLVGFFVANLLGAIVGSALIAARRMDRKSHIPFGVFLALGAAVAVFGGAPILRWYPHR